MGKPHSFRKYKKEIKFRYGRWWNKSWKWPGNFHPREVYIMYHGGAFYLPNEDRMMILPELSIQNYRRYAEPFLERYRSGVL